MASKRMFNLNVIDTDAFLEMPLSTQALYFHLNMRADDDGFVGSPKIICRTVGASEDDLKLLIAKRFILSFADGVIVIKHWRMHNNLSRNRYKETNYTEDKAMLRLKSNNAYTLDCSGSDIDDSRLIESSSRQIDAQKTQHRRNIDAQKTQPDKIREDKNRIDKIREDKNRIDKGSISCQQIADLYNDTCVSFPRVTTLSDARKKAIKARLNNYSIEDFENLFVKAEASTFLKGGNNRNWSANFDWLIKDSNMAKVLDGNYDNKPANNGNQKAQELDSFYSMASEWAQAEQEG